MNKEFETLVANNEKKFKAAGLNEKSVRNLIKKTVTQTRQQDKT